MLAPIKILSRNEELAFDDCKRILDYLKSSLEQQVAILIIEDPVIPVVIAPSDLDTKKIPPFWTGCPCRLRENWAGSSGAGFDIEDMGTVLGTVPRSSSSLPPLLSSR